MCLSKNYSLTVAACGICLENVPCGDTALAEERELILRSVDKNCRIETVLNQANRKLLEAVCSVKVKVRSDRYTVCPGIDLKGCKDWTQVTGLTTEPSFQPSPPIFFLFVITWYCLLYALHCTIRLDLGTWYANQVCLLLACGEGTVPAKWRSGMWSYSGYRVADEVLTICCSAGVIWSPLNPLFAAHLVVLIGLLSVFVPASCMASDGKVRKVLPKCSFSLVGSCPGNQT